MNDLVDDSVARFLDRIEALVKREAWAEAAAECRNPAEAARDCAEAAFVRSLAAYHRDDIRGAVTEGEAAFAEQPEVSEFAGWLSTLYVLAGDFAKSVYYAKLAGALGSNPRIKSWMPSSLPTFAEVFPKIEELPLMARAMTAASWSRWAEAENWFRQHVAFEPGHREGHLALARCLFVQGRFQGAAQSLQAALHHLPSDARLAALLSEALVETGRFHEAIVVGERAVALDPEDAEIAATVAMNALAAPSLALGDVVRPFAEWGRKFAMKPGGLGPVPKVRRKARLTLGFFLGSVGRKAMAGALATILARHDARRFRIVGFGFGQITDPQNIVFQKAFDTWHDVRDTDPFTLGSMMAAEDVDVLVDLSGFNTPNVLAGMGGRMAPIQVSWDGAPLGTGIPAFDALLTDAVMDPEGQELPYTERPVRLSLGAFVAELPPSDLPLAGTDQGETAGITFVADATLAELSPETVSAWADILLGTPGSTLLLRDHDFRDEANTERLIDLFGIFGIAHRIDVADSEQPGRLFAQGDVALVPLNTSRTEGILDALWAGLPAIVLSGENRCRREGASFLSSLGLAAEMVAGDVASYRDLALGWAGDESRRASFRTSIRTRLEESPVFDAQARMADLEKALEALWEEACVKAGT
jgi:tetratricopeptide (TPR) repeat protein